MKERRVVAVGATGYTGRLVAAELERQALPFTLTARDPAKLERLAAEVGGPPTRVVDVRDEAALRDAVGPGDVVLSCAGPFMELGEPVVRAAVSAGAHYLDTSGEQPFMVEMSRHYGAAARDAGVAVVVGMAYEYALGDCAAALAAQGLETPLRSLDVTYAWGGGGGSRGTRRTGVRMVEAGGYARVDGQLRRQRMAARRRRVTLPGGKTVSAFSFPSGEVVTVPRHVEVEKVQGWMVAGGGTARALNLLSPLLSGLARALSPVTDALLRRQPDGPSPEARMADAFTILLEAVDARGLERRVAVRGRDAYGLTAAIMVLGARACLAGPPLAGALAPSQLVAPETLFGALEGVSVE